MSPEHAHETPAPIRTSAGRLESLSEIADAINQDEELTLILNQIVKSVCTHSVWSRSSLMRADEGRGLSILVTEYSPYSLRGPEASHEWQLSTSPTIEVLRTGQFMIIPDAMQAHHLPGYREDAIRLGYRTVVVLPLGAFDSDGHHLVLTVSSLDEVNVDEIEIGFLKTVTHLVSIAVQKAVRLERERRLNTALRDSVVHQTELMNRILSGGSTADVVQEVSVSLGQQFMLIDALAGRVHLGSPATLPRSSFDWEQFQTEPGFEALVDCVLRLAETADPPVPGAELPGQDIENAPTVELLHIDSHVVGALVVDSPGDEFDQLRLSEAKTAVSVQLMRRYIEARVGAEGLTEMFNRLITGNWRDEQEMIAQARRAGLRVDQPHQLIATALDESATGPVDWYVARHLQRGMLGVDPNALVHVDEVRLLVLLPVSRNQNARLSRCERYLRSKLDNIITENTAFAVSEPCKCCNDYVEAYRATRHALRLAGVLGRTGLVRESDFGPYGLLLEASTQPAVARFVTNVLGPLQDYDERHHTELVPTLNRFLAHGRRLQRSADELGIHVSTLRYRVERITELLGTDLDDHDIQFSLQLALRLEELRRPAS